MKVTESDTVEKAVNDESAASMIEAPAEQSFDTTSTGEQSEGVVATAEKCEMKNKPKEESAPSKNISESGATEKPQFESAAATKPDLESAAAPKPQFESAAATKPKLESAATANSKSKSATTTKPKFESAANPKLVFESAFESAASASAKEEKAEPKDQISQEDVEQIAGGFQTALQSETKEDVFKSALVGDEKATDAHKTDTTTATTTTTTTTEEKPEKKTAEVAVRKPEGPKVKPCFSSKKKSLSLSGAAKRPAGGDKEKEGKVKKSKLN